VGPVGASPVTSVVDRSWPRVLHFMLPERTSTAARADRCIVVPMFGWQQGSRLMKALRGLSLGVLGVSVFGLAATQVWAHCGKCAGDCKVMVTAMDSSKATASSMIAAAEAASKGKAIGMTCTLDKGKMTAMVYCVADAKVQAVAVDAEGKAGKVKEMKDADGRVAQSMESEKMTAAKVIEAAEAHSKGKALAMIAERKGSGAVFEVYALVEDAIQKVDVNESGTATAMTEAKALPDQVVKKIIRGG